MRRSRAAPAASVPFAQLQHPADACRSFEGFVLWDLPRASSDVPQGGAQVDAAHEGAGDVGVEGGEEQEGEGGGGGGGEEGGKVGGGGGDDVGDDGVGHKVKEVRRRDGCAESLQVIGGYMHAPQVNIARGVLQTQQQRHRQQAGG